MFTYSRLFSLLCSLLLLHLLHHTSISCLKQLIPCFRVICEVLNTCVWLITRIFFHLWCSLAEWIKRKQKAMQAAQVGCFARLCSLFVIILWNSESAATAAPKEYLKGENIFLPKFHFLWFTCRDCVIKMYIRTYLRVVNKFTIIKIYMIKWGRLQKWVEDWCTKCCTVIKFPQCVSLF